MRSFLRLGLAPLGHRVVGSQEHLSSVCRKEHGLIVVLPGIEGNSTVNESIVQGLIAGKLSHSIHVMDWRRFRPWNPLHMAMRSHNHLQAERIAEHIRAYRSQFPDGAVHLIGHSAGAGMAIFVLECLNDLKISSAILMAAAISRDYPIQELLPRTTLGIWNFYSPLDLPAVGLGTMLFGTMDRRHAISAGALGFRQTAAEQAPEVSGPLLHQIRFSLQMVKAWNFGGHFGWTNAEFVRQHVSPLLTRY
jgi:pimeloyl-ACP methyl ester carboxylesterase